VNHVVGTLSGGDELSPPCPQSGQRYPNQDCDAWTLNVLVIMRNFAFVVLTAGFVLAGLTSASAQIIPGTHLTGNIDQSLNSKNAHVGQTFTITNAHSANSDITNGVIYGHVAAVQKAGQGTPGKIELAFDRLKTGSGNVYTIVAYATSITVNTKSNATKEALATAGGALIGGLLGKGVGAVIGGAGAYVYAKNNREDVTIPNGSLVTVDISGSTRISK
jgi:hypothetical protein